MISKLGALTGILFMSAQALAQPTPSTNDVWQHHISAWNQRNVEAIAADYSDDSVLIINGVTFEGTDAIKTAFVQLFNIFDHGDNRIDPTVINDRIIYITWHFTPTGTSEFFGSDTFLIERGKIVVQTIASPLYAVYPVTR